jgi:hypothetical protein
MEGAYSNLSCTAVIEEERQKSKRLSYMAKLTETGKIKHAAPSEVARWVLAAWKAIPESIIVRSFKKCCISNALDGSEDDIVREDDVEEKDDSDRVESTDNDSVMSNDGESDE